MKYRKGGCRKLSIALVFLQRRDIFPTTPPDGGATRPKKKKIHSSSPLLSLSLFRPALSRPDRSDRSELVDLDNSGPKAEAAELRARFLARESRFNVPLPHTSDPGSARELGRLLSGVRVLRLDERSSALGGATDALAAALVNAAAAGASAEGEGGEEGARGKGASRLRELDVAFRPHSWAADLFSDAGLVALARAAAATEAEEADEGGEGEQEDREVGLVRLRLHGAGAVSDGGLAALAACSPCLRDFELTGYTELVSDRGISALAGNGGGRQRGRNRRRRRPSSPSFVSETSSSSSLSSSSSSPSLAEAAEASSSSSTSFSSSDSEAESLPRPSFSPPSSTSVCCCALERLCLGERLPRVSDAGIVAVVARAARLRILRLPGRCTDAALFAAARSPCAQTLEEVDASACVAVTAEGARALARACPRLRSLRLPPGVDEWTVCEARRGLRSSRSPQR